MTTGLAPTSSQSFLSALHSGVRLERPQFCAEEMYGLMAKCWSITPEDRPTFRYVLRARLRLS